MTENYRGCYEYLSAQYPEVGGYEFYKELFPDNENDGERHTDFSHPNAVYLYRDEQSEGKKLRRRKMYNDTWEQDYMEFVERNSLTLCQTAHRIFLLIRVGIKRLFNRIAVHAASGKLHIELALALFLAGRAHIFHRITAIVHIAKTLRICHRIFCLFG